MSTESVLKDLNEVLNARGSKRIGYSINPATGIESLTRAFRVDYDRYLEMARHLDSFADAKNCDPDAPVETEYVTDPDVGRASNFPGKWVHSGCSQNQEANALLQMLTRVYDITTNASLWERQAIPAYDNEILGLFGLAESEGDAVVFTIRGLTKESRAFCMAIADADLVTNLPGSTFSYSNRRFEVDPESNSAVFMVVFRKVANNAFDASSADIDWYTYRYTKQEQHHQLWMRINNGDALTNLYTAATGYNVTTVSISESEAGSLTIQRTQLIEGLGTADSPYDEERTEIMNPHGMESGTKYHVTVQNHHLKLLSTAYGTIAAAHSGYTIVDTDEKEEGNGLWTKLYKYEKVSWNAWGHDSAAADETNYSNVDSERQTITKTWKGIQLSDIGLAVSQCIAGIVIEPETDYIITDVRATESAEGSFQIDQVQTKQINNEQETHAELLHPHALKSGVLARVKISYENFHEATLPAPANYVPGTDAGVISNDKIGPDGNGLWSRVIVTEAVTWNAWTNAAADLVDYGSEGKVDQKLKATWFAIQKSDHAAAIAALVTGGTIGATTGYVVDSVGVNDNRDGSLTLTQNQSKMVKGATGSEIEEDGQEKVAPFGIPEAGTKNTVRIINTNLDAPSSAYVTLSTANTGYTLVDTKEILNGGTWTVVHIYEKMTWKTFVSDITLYDTQDVSAPGRDNETRTKTWDHIQKSDLIAAVAYLESTADSGYYVRRLSVSDNRNGSIRLVQTTKNAVNAAVAGKVEGINSHSLQKGVLTQTVTIYLDFDLDDLPPGTDPTSANDYVLNQKQGPDSDGLYSRTNIAETTLWKAWGHDGGTQDLTSYQNAGTDKEVRIRIWFGIQKADLSTAESECVGGTGSGTPDAGYEVSGVNIRDNQNGSITVTQTTPNQNNAGNGSTGTVRIDPHDASSAIVLSTVTTIVTVYEDFAESDLPAGDLVLLGSTIISNVKRQQGNGLYRRDVVAQTVSTDGSWDNKILVGESNGDGQAKSQTHEATGIPLSGLVAAFSAVVADSGFVMAAKSLRYAGNGRFTFVRSQQNTESGSTENDAVVTYINPGNIGTRSPTIIREWYRRTEAAKNTLLGGAAVATINYGGQTYIHSHVNVTDHHDGAFTVTQTGIDDTSGLSGAWIDSDVAIYQTQSRTTSSGVDEYRIITHHRYVKFAYSWLDVFGKMKAVQTGTVKITRPGVPQNIGGSLWTITFDTADTTTLYGAWTTI